MDFHSLSRKELQTLCKKNKIPANITNVAMADALAALPQIEGLDEFLNTREADDVARTPDIHHHPRTTTRRKVTKEPESNKLCSRVQRGSRAKNVEVEQDSNAKILPLPVTPAVMPPSSRRRALPVSTRRKKEEKEEDGDGDNKNGVPLQTPAALHIRATGRTPRGGTTLVQPSPSYSTRRSVRLLEKNLSMMTLLDNEDVGSANIDHAVSQGSTETQKVNDVGASLQTVSTVVSEETDEMEVSSLEKNTEYEECQSHDSGSEIQPVSGAGFHADPQEEGLVKVNCLEAEQHDSNLKPEGISETFDDSNEVGDCCDDLAVDLKKSISIEVGDCCDDLAVDLKKSISIEEAVREEVDDTESELLPELEGFSEPENKDCCGTKQDALSAEASEDAFMEFTEQDVAALPVEVPVDASLDVADPCVAASVPMSLASGDSVKLQELVEWNTDNQDSNEDDDNQDKNNETGLEVADQYVALSVEVPDDALEVGVRCVAGLVPIPSTSADSVKLEELAEGNADNQGSNEYGDNQLKNNEIADDDYIENLETMFDGVEKAADEKDLASPVEVLGLVSSNFCFSGQHQEEELKDISEHSEDSIAEIERMDNASDVTSASFTAFAVEKDEDFENCIGVHKAEDLNDNSEKLEAKAQPEDSEDPAFDFSGASSAILAVEMDATFENSTTVKEFSSETAADKSIMDAENVALESSLLDEGVHEAEDLKDNSEILESKALADESEEHIAGEETVLDAASAFPSVLGGISNPHISQQISLESTGISIDSCSSVALMSVPSCNSNTLVDGDDISEEIAIPKLEPSETVAVAPIHEQKISDVPLQSLVADQLKGESLFPAQSETKGFANEIHMHNANTMKENLTTDELDKKSIRELKKMLKNLTLNGKSYCKSKTDNVVKEMEKKRTALQILPENRMTNLEAQNDG